MKFFSSEKLNHIDSLNFNPGPGHYDHFSRQTKHKPTPTATISTRNQKNGPNSAFGMSSIRFQEPKKENIDTGPGFYFGQNEWNAKKTQKEAKAQFYPNPRKIITIPSIPSSTHAMGYVEREDGYLIPLNGAAAKDQQDLGPGAYHASDLIFRKRPLGFNLGRTKSPRFPTDKSMNVSGIANAEPTEPAKRDIIANEFAMQKKEQKSKPPQPKPEVIKEPEPGLDPGHYYNERNVSSFKSQFKAPEFQYFGSTAKRFTTPQGAQVLPGPGAYNDPTSNKSHNPYLIQRVEPFSKGETRFIGSGTQELPGPGQYELPSSVTPREVVSGPSGGLQSAFGSGLTRFGVQRANSETPGPGSYNPAASKKRRKNRNKRKIMSVNSHNELRLSETPKEPSWGAEFDFGGRSKGAVIVKHEAPSNKGTATFASVAKRFEDNKNGGRSLTPGPGAYTGAVNNDLIKKSFSTMKTSFALNPRDKEEGKGSAYKSILGPGLYDYEVDIIKPNANFAVKINPKSPFAATSLPK